MTRGRLLSGTFGLTVVALCLTVSAHERKEVAGLEVVFGAEPEPALNGQMQFLRWRLLSKESKQPFGDIEDKSATVKRNGKTNVAQRCSESASAPAGAGPTGMVRPFRHAPSPLPAVGPEAAAPRSPLSSRTDPPAPHCYCRAEGVQRGVPLTSRSTHMLPPIRT